MFWRAAGAQRFDVCQEVGHATHSTTDVAATRAPRSIRGDDGGEFGGARPVHDHGVGAEFHLALDGGRALLSACPSRSVPATRRG